MSGPKVSIYRVEPYIRENVLLQQRLKRKCISLGRQIHDKISDLTAVSEKCKEFAELQKSLGNAENAVPACEAMIETVRTQREKLAACLHAAGRIEALPKKYRYSPETVEHDSKKVHELEKILQDSRKICAGAQEQALALMNQYRIDTEKVIKNTRKAVAGIGRFDFDSISVQKVHHDWSRRDAAVERVRMIAGDPELSDGLRQRAGAAAQTLMSFEDEYAAGNYISIAVAEIEREAERERSRKKEELSEYHDRIADYRALCSEAGTEPVPIPYSEGWREAIGEAVHQLESITQRNQEKSYISDCLNAVMAEMGYQIIGYRNVKKKSGRTFHSALYSYAEGRAINVTQSDDGQITMELGGLDHGDRLPEGFEAESLEADMYSFCDSFAEIEKKLRKKGVILDSRISKPAPDQEYATIINLDDFMMVDSRNVETIEVADLNRAAEAREMYEN